ncbi:MAG: hypothetical protein ACSHWR_04035 [Psychromonas sp.]
MAKLWLTDKGYPIWGYLLRLVYWLLAIYTSSQFLEAYQAYSWFKAGLIALSIVFVVSYLLFTRFIDRFITKPSID